MNEIGFLNDAFYICPQLKFSIIFVSYIVEEWHQGSISLHMTSSLKLESFDVISFLQMETPLLILWPA